MTRLGKLGTTATALMRQALQSALASAGMELRDLDGLVAVPSLSHPHFMEAHYLATQMGLLPQRAVVARTLDTGGAGPVSGLLEALRLIRSEWCETVAVVAGDAISTLSSEEFLKRADQGCADPLGSLPSPVIPSGYDRVARWHMEAYGTTREQLAMVSVLMSRLAARHPEALSRVPHTLQDVLSSRQIAPCTNLLECARRADGGAAIVLASSRWLERRGLAQRPNVVVVSGGEASGPLYPPPIIDESMFSCERAAQLAYEQSCLTAEDIDFFGFIRALEAVGLAEKGQGGDWVEYWYNRSNENADDLPPVNTHGGLCTPCVVAFGAPWETPAMFNIIEAFRQLTGQAGRRQVDKCRRALVYGNGGIFSASAVAILSRPLPE